MSFGSVMPAGPPFEPFYTSLKGSTFANFKCEQENHQQRVWHYIYLSTCNQQQQTISNRNKSEEWSVLLHFFLSL